MIKSFWWEWPPTETGWKMATEEIQVEYMTVFKCYVLYHSAVKFSSQKVD